MVDARLPGPWLTNPRMDALSDRAWRTFTGALMWSNEAGTDGEIPQRAMRFLHPYGVDGATLAELVEADLFEPAGADVRVCGWVENGQELAENIRAKKEANRVRQQQFRDKTKKKAPRITGDVTGDVTQDVGQESDRDSDSERTSTGGGSDLVTSWPTAVPGEGRLSA